MPTKAPRFHFQISTLIGTETWRYRIYSVDYNAVSSFTSTLDMMTHAQYLGTQEPMPLNESLLAEPGKRTDSTDGDITQGNPSFENMELKLFADPAFAPIVPMLRDLSQQIWLEIVIDQPVQDCPELRAGEMFWPRKTRSHFWGKALRTSSVGSIDRQISQVIGADWQTTTGVHVGTFTLSFVHWLKVAGAEIVLNTAAPVPFWLSNVTSDLPAPSTMNVPVTGPDTPPATVQPIPVLVRVSELLYELLSCLSPSPLFAIADHRLVHFDGLNDTVLSVSRGNLNFRDALFDGNLTPWNNLAHVLIIRFIYAFTGYALIGGAWFAQFSREDGPLFDSSSSPNEMSLYNLKDLSEALVRLTAEFIFEFHVEIPLMDDMIEHRTDLTLNGNKTLSRLTNWNLCVRWLFPWCSTPLKAIYLDPDESSIQYTPAANWLSSAQYDEPTPEGFGPSTWTVDLGYDPEKTNGFTSKTLFRFAAFTTDSHGIQTFSFGNAELYAGATPVLTAPLGAVSAVQYTFVHNGFTFKLVTDWARYHALLQMNRWGMPFATVEFDNNTRALEPFGASNTKSPRPKRTFGVGDIGDFPRSRYFVMDPGLMHVAQKPDATRGGVMNAYTKFCCYEISFTPGKPTHILGIEIGSVDPGTGSSSTVTTTVMNTIDPPSGPPTVPGTPPTGGPIPTILLPTGGSVTGVVPVIIQIVPASPTAPVANVKFLVNNVFTDMLTIANGTGSTWKFSWNAALVSSGTYVLKVIATDILGIANSASVTVTV